MPTVSRKNRRGRTLAAGAAVALGAAVAPELNAAIITVDSTADTVMADGDCTLREAVLNANDDAATSPDCAAGDDLNDEINFTGLALPATITLSGTTIEITDALIITGPGQANLTIDGDDASRVFTITDAAATILDVSISNLTITGGSDTVETLADGGAILTEENLTLNAVTLTENATDFSGGAIGAHGVQAVPITLTIDDSTITNNDALCCGGGISTAFATVTITDSVISGNTAITAGAGVALYRSYGVTISNTTISGNTGVIAGGGLYFYGGSGTLTVANSTITGNESILGGGVFISHASGAVEINDTTISGNTALAATGGLYLEQNDDVTVQRTRIIGNDGGNYAGGVTVNDATVVITDSEISGNTSVHTGGLYANFGSYLTLRNSTVADNTATDTIEFGIGGIHINASTATIELSTISGNDGISHGNVFTYGSTVDITNSIIANGVSDDVLDLQTMSSTVTMNYSLLEDDSDATFTGANNITGVDPQLGTLQDNGGTTQTMKPALTSPVIDAGDPAFTPPPATDQRGTGFPRVTGDAVEMGAVELQPGTLAFSTDSYDVNENAGTVTITVTRTGGTDGAVSVNFTTSPGTALAGADYTTNAGTLNWADGDSDPKTFMVTILDDNIFEGTEPFNVSLNTPTGDAALGTALAVVNILDNEVQPTVSISSEAEAEGTSLVFDVTLSHPSTQTITVDFATSGVTATSGTDFTANSNQLTFNPLVTSQQITVVTTQDNIDEANETLNVTLSNPVNASLGTNPGTGTINDDDPTPTITIANDAETEGTSLVFDVTLSNPSSQTITVDFATAGVTATSGTDFTANSSTLTFIAGDTSESITVVTTQDNIDEPDETLSVTLSDPVNASISGGPATGTINDDDAQPAITIAGDAESEGTSLVFDVTLSNPSTNTITVDFATAGITATSGTDFTANNGQLTFNPLVTSQQITVVTTQDNIDEPNETLSVTLSNPTGASVAGDPATGTINDDDAQPTIAISDETEAEGTSHVFDVTLSHPTTSTVTVNFATAGNDATSGTDFTANNGTLTFNPLDTSEQVTVATAQDNIDEAHETFNVVLSDPVSASIGDTTGLGTITDDDAIPTISITSVAQGEGSSFIFDVTLSHPTTNTVTVNFATSGVTAISGTDFTANNGTLTFNPLVTTQQITVLTTQDNIDEPDETFNVVLSDAVNATIAGGTGVGTIQDDEAQPSIQITNVTEVEGDSLVFEVTLSHPSTNTITVDFATAGVSADSGVDFNANNGTLTFNPMDTSEQVTVTTIEEVLDEPDETFNVVLSNPTASSIADDTGVGTIADDDGQPSILISNVAQTEGGNLVFDVTLSNPTTNTVTVDFATAGVDATSGTDFTANNGQLMFVPLATSQQITVATIQDTIDEPDETLNVVLTNPANAAIADDTGVGTITDDDVTPTISVSSVSQAEGGSLVFDVTLSNPSSQTITVDFATASGTATSGADFLPNSGKLTFNPGVTAQQVTVTGAQDTIDEPSETFTVALTDPVNATVGTNGTGTITDDDATPVISISNVTQAEGTSFVFDVTLSNPSSQTITVDFATAGVLATSGTDFTPNNGTLTFNPGMTAQQITVATTQDTIDESNETFTVDLSNPANATTAGSGLGTITDDDPTPSITASNVTQLEGTSFVFDVTLSNPSSQTITVDFVAAGGSAISGTDFTPNNGTLTFNPGVTTQQITVVTTQDTIDESNENFSIALSNAANATIAANGTGVITDDDGTPSISVNSVTQLEGTSFVFDVTLSNPSSQTITVDFATAGVSATSGTDFTPNAGTLTFNPGVTTQQVTVVTTQDTIDEANETFSVALSNAINATIAGNGLGTITDDDGTPSISVNSAAQLEGTSIVFDVTLSNASAQPITVDFATAGGSATSGTDFTPNSGTLTFSAGVTAQQITVATTQDAIDEPNETFSVGLSNATNATIANATGTGTITDDDGSPALTIGDVMLAEGDGGATSFELIVTLAPVSGQTVTVSYATQDISALAGSDYTAAAGTLTFTAGETSETITVQVSGDTAIESNEVFHVVLSNATNATVADGTGVGTITNDDSAITADLSVTKQADGTGPFTVGGNATFTIVVTNAGPDAAANVVVTDILPAGTSFVSASPSCTGTTTITCNAGTLDNGESATFTLTLQLDAPGEISNTATAASDAADATPAAGTATIIVSPAAAGAAIPTASQWMLMALAAALAALGLRNVRS